MVTPHVRMDAPKASARRVAVVAILIGFAVSVRAAEPAANMTLDDIAAAVEAARSRVDDLSVDFTYNAVRGDPKNLFYRSEMRVQVKGGKVVYRHIYGAAPSTGERLFIRHIAFDGRHTTTYDGKMVAAVEAGRSSETSLKGMGFFDLMLWNRPEGAEGAGDMDLATMLRSPETSLRPETEAVRGTPCYVVDVKVPRFEKTSVTLWLDPARGFLPLRHVWFVGPDPAKADMEFDVEEAVEAPPGVWCATAGRKVLHPFGTVVKQECEWRMVVDREPDGRPKIRLNSGIDDQVFQPWRSLPPGQFLVDSRTGKGAAVGGADYDAMVASLDLTPAAADASTADRGRGWAGGPARPPLGSAPGARDSRSAWLWAGVVLAAVALGGLTLGVWRRRARQACQRPMGRLPRSPRATRRSAGPPFG
jgi:outer membrane lipoprotein-sorting protein